MSDNIKKTGALIALIAPLVIAAADARAQDFTLVGAGGILQDAERAAYFEPFAKARGLDIAEDSYSGQMAKIRAMVDSGTVTWDVVQMEQDSVVAGCDEGLFVPIDWSRIGDPDDFVPSAYLECGVGAFVWAMVPSFDTDRLPEGPETWADFWDTATWPGKRGFRATAKMTLEIALLADGVAPDEVYAVLATREGQDRAFAKLDEIKDDILWWTSGAESVERIVAGDVAMSATFNGRVTGANQDGAHLAQLWDGQVYGTDYWVIVSGTEHEELAQDFVHFASQPENQAEFPKHVTYGVTNKAAIDMIPAELAALLPTKAENMANSVALSTEFWSDNGESLEARFANWRSQ